MALQARRAAISSKSKLVSPLLDADNYPARLVQVIDLGMQANTFDLEKVDHKVMLTYELDGVFCQDDKGADVLDKPRWISEEINMIDLPIGMDLNEIYNDQFRGKAKMVTRSRAFDPKGNEDFDFSAMIDSPCAVTIVQKKKKDGNMKNDIGGVTAPMRGMVVAPLINPPKVFALDAPDMEVFGSLPAWVQDKVKGNLEFAGSPLAALLGGAAPEPKQPQAQAPKNPPEAAEEPVANEDAAGDNW